MAGLSVTTAPTSEPITRDEAKSFLRVDISDDDTLIDNFVKKTNFVCDSYWTQPVQEKLKRQRGFYRDNYSREVRLKEWEALL